MLRVKDTHFSFHPYLHGFSEPEIQFYTQQHWGHEGCPGMGYLSCQFDWQPSSGSHYPFHLYHLRETFFSLLHPLKSSENQAWMRGWPAKLHFSNFCMLLVKIYISLYGALFREKPRHVPKQTTAKLQFTYFTSTGHRSQIVKMHVSLLQSQKAGFQECSVSPNFTYFQFRLFEC